MRHEEATTLWELDRLPVGAIVANLANGHAWMKTWESRHPRKDGTRLSEWAATGREERDETEDIPLPASILHRGTNE